MTNTTIIDNFLSQEEHENISNLMFSNNFPWFVAKTIDSYKDNELDTKELVHLFYTNYSINSTSFEILNSLINKINPISLIRIRAALMPKKQEQLLKEKDYHTDNNFNCTTAIYYVNTNNGYTIFKDGTKVESVANRFVSFDSNLEHAGTYCSDQDFRCIINFNYF
jgi:hypothetical protein